MRSRSLSDFGCIFIIDSYLYLKMKKELLFLTLVVIIGLTVFYSCGEKNLIPKNNCEFSTIDQDTLFTDLVTYIHRPPNRVSAKNRFLPQHRNWFVNSTELFEWLHCHRSEDGTYYFYMKRPARNIHGHMRGIGGTFKLDESGQIIDFKEIFNTYMITPEEVIKLGPRFFSIMVEHTHIPTDSDLWKKIEFPNDASFYDTEIFEWSYSQ